jgi:hypothetical protein
MLLPFISIAATTLSALTAFDQSYTDYAELLSKYVCESGVVYEELVDEPALDTIDRTFAALSRQEFESYSVKEQLAYLINVYNFYTLALIQRNYPLASINNLTRPWDQEFVPLFGKKVSLNYIEHKLLRKQYDEPRIHFALNCASRSCPRLLKKPFVGARLDEQLDYAAKEFLTDTTRNRIDKKTLRLSKLFEWYGDDFKNPGGYKAYVKQTLGLEGKYRVRFLEYDWGLNETQTCP